MEPVSCVAEENVDSAYCLCDPCHERIQLWTVVDHGPEIEPHPYAYSRCGHASQLESRHDLMAGSDGLECDDPVFFQSSSVSGPDAAVKLVWVSQGVETLRGRVSVVPSVVVCGCRRGVAC